MIEIRPECKVANNVTITMQKFEELLDLETRVQVLEDLINSKSVFTLSTAVQVLGLKINENKKATSVLDEPLPF